MARHEAASNLPIDIVLPWVDDTDSEWQAARAAHREAPTEDGSVVRYRNWDNLHYVFRSIEQNLPWVRYIFFVTAGYVPSWLNTDHPKLRILRHTDYIPAEFLPTFNAIPIELNLHRIDELSEQFIYFNDDMFILKPMHKTQFFKHGLPRDNFKLAPVSPDQKRGIFPHILLNNASIINAHFDKSQTVRRQWRKVFSWRYGVRSFVSNMLMMPYEHFVGFSTYHIPSPFLKKTFREVWEAEPDIMHSASGNAYRSSSDVNQYLMRAWQLMKGEFLPIGLERLTLYAEVTDTATDEICDDIMSRRKAMLCLNDVDETLNFPRTKRRINRALQSVFPNKSSYEK